MNPRPKPVRTPKPRKQAERFPVCVVALCSRPRLDGFAMCRRHNEDRRLSVGIFAPRAQQKRPMMRAKPPRRIGKAGDLPAYRDFVRGLPCAAIGMVWAGTCRGRVEAHHAGRKSDDTSCIPLCSDHHKFRGWHSHLGPFKGWSKGLRRDWSAYRIIETQALWNIAHPAERVGDVGSPAVEVAA